MEVKSIEIHELIGQRLLGYMPLKTPMRNGANEYPHGDWDNAIALYLGPANNPKCVVLRSENQDYSRYDQWVAEQIDEIIPRDSRYKTIGEEILSITNRRDDLSDYKNDNYDEIWTSGKDVYWLEISTNTKRLRLGHRWNDCHYPNSIWEFI